MYILYQKMPYADKSGKSGYVMTWRGKQIAMCAEREPLEKWIKAQNDPKKYYIEKQPEH